MHQGHWHFPLPGDGGLGTWVSSLFLLLEGSPLLNVLYSSTITVAGGPFVSPDTIWLGAETPMPLPPAQSPWSGGAHAGAGRGPTPASTSGLTLDAKRGRPVPAAGSGLWQVPAPAPSHPRVVRDVCRTLGVALCGLWGSGSNSGSACCCGGQWGAWGWGQPQPVPWGPIPCLPLPARDHCLSMGVQGCVLAPPYADQTGDRAATCHICTLIILEGWGAAARQGPPNSGSRGVRGLPCSGRL